MTNPRNDGNTAAKDEARTPKIIFDALDKEFHFDIDVAADENNTLCTSFFALHNPVVDNPMQLTKLPLAIDALNQDWTNWTRVGAETFFCNPPYSAGNIIKFVHKAWLESGNGATVVLLIPSDPSTQYFEFCFENASEIRFMHPRVKFNNPDGTPMKGSPTTGSMIVVFGPNDDGPAKISIWRWKEMTGSKQQPQEHCDHECVCGLYYEHYESQFLEPCRHEINCPHDTRSRPAPLTQNDGGNCMVICQHCGKVTQVQCKKDGD